jgi:N-methylhydantoinase B/oxoprolinase/acetone carboxylase alpha subunit
MNIYQLFPEEHEMTAADLQARIAALEQALREIQQMSIRRQIEDLDDMIEGINRLTPRSVFPDSVWLESLHEICERALEQTK